jgi:hypothetical protein
MRIRSIHALFVSSSLVAVAAAGLSVLPAYAQDTVPAPAPAPSDAKASADAPVAAPPITITGAVEANYTYNFNQPFNGSNTYLYNTNAGQFAVNLADLRIGRAATDTSRVGFFVRLVEGEVARRNFNAGDNNLLLEGYGTFLVPLRGGRNLKVDAGQFVTHVGYETIEIGTNNFFSRNFLFQFPSPFYNGGVRASYPVSDKLTVNGYIYNRYNGVFDPKNNDLAPGFQVVYTASPTTSIVLNGLTSRENLAYDGTSDTAVDNRQQSVIDLIATSQITPRVKLVAEGLYRWGDYSQDVFGDDTASDLSSRQVAIGTRKQSYSVAGAALYGIFTMGNGNLLGLRGEYLSQSKSDGPIFQYPTSDEKPNLGSVTLSFEPASSLRLFPGLRTILEYRFDFAGKEFFPGKTDGSFKKNQSSFTIGQVYNF